MLEARDPPDEDDTGVAVGTLPDALRWNGVAVGTGNLVAVGRIIVAVGTGTGVRVAIICGSGVDVAKGVEVTRMNGVFVGRGIRVGVGGTRTVAVGSVTMRAVGVGLTASGGSVPDGEASGTGALEVEVARLATSVGSGPDGEASGTSVLVVGRTPVFEEGVVSVAVSAVDPQATAPISTTPKRPDTQARMPGLLPPFLFHIIFQLLSSLAFES